MPVSLTCHQVHRWRRGSALENLHLRRTLLHLSFEFLLHFLWHIWCVALIAYDAAFGQQTCRNFTIFRISDLNDVKSSWRMGFSQHIWDRWQVLDPHCKPSYAADSSLSYSSRRSLGGGVGVSGILSPHQMWLPNKMGLTWTNMAREIPYEVDAIPIGKMGELLGLLKSKPLRGSEALQRLCFLTFGDRALPLAQKAPVIKSNRILDGAGQWCVSHCIPSLSRCPTYVCVWLSVRRLSHLSRASSQSRGCSDLLYSFVTNHFCTPTN